MSASGNGDDSESLQKRLASGAWFGPLNEVIKQNVVDEDEYPQDITPAESAAGFELMDIPNYGKLHYAMTPDKASAVAIARPDGGHIVKTRGISAGRVHYQLWPDSSARRPVESSEVLQDVKLWP